MLYDLIGERSHNVVQCDERRGKNVMYEIGYLFHFIPIIAGLMGGVYITQSHPVAWDN